MNLKVLMSHSFQLSFAILKIGNTASVPGYQDLVFPEWS